MTAYYNEIDPNAAAWLRNLAEAGHIMAGTVDERSIADVSPADLVGATRVHLFAGIGGWDLALCLAGIPDDLRIWTGSCPCQPFSQAGARRGTADERHLWPEMRRLIAECRPAIVVGEQVASADGRAWLASVRTDLEDLGYAVGAADLCAAGVGAPHIRQRLYWGARLGDAGQQRRDGLDALLRPGQAGRDAGALSETARGGGAGGVADADRSGPGPRAALDHLGAAGTHADGRRRLGDTDGAGLAGRPRQRSDDGAQRAPAERAGGAPVAAGHAREAHGGWGAPDWLRCRDGRWRPVESGAFPLAHGVPGRVGRLRGYGNAIVPQVAALFVRALLS